jgi:hypothetical protein
MGEMRNVYKILVQHHFEDAGVNEMMILEWILKKQGQGVYSGFIWLWVGTSGGVL